VGAHDGLGDIVGFAFCGVVGVADGELGLDQAGAQEVLDGLVASVVLELKKRQGTIR
jgi:hypothetical protein